MRRLPVLYKNDLRIPCFLPGKNIRRIIKVKLKIGKKKKSEKDGGKNVRYAYEKIDFRGCK